MLLGQSAQPIQPQIVNLEIGPKKKKKVNILTYPNSFQLLVAASHKSVILKAFKKFKSLGTFINRK